MSTNLPITSGAPQTPAIAAKNANSANTGEAADAQNIRPFGEVLARQIKNPLLKDVKLDVEFVAETPAQSAPIASGREQPAGDIKAETIPADAATALPGALPADMLAALIPQALNAVATGTSAKSDGSADPVQHQPVITAIRTDAGGKTPAGNTSVIANGNNPAPKAAEQTFPAAMIEPANRAAATELNAVAREAIPVPAAQPGAMLASMQATVASFAAPAVQAAVQATVNTPVGREKWGDEFSQKITWLASTRQDQTAELHLNPPQLGPLDVVLKVSGDQATALFTSPHAAVRDAIEQALPRLRDMLADNGIALGNATVSDQTSRDSNPEAARQKASDAHNSPNDSAAPAETPARVSPISRHNGIVDTFA